MVCSTVKPMCGANFWNVEKVFFRYQVIFWMYVHDMFYDDFFLVLWSGLKVQSQTYFPWWVIRKYYLLIESHVYIRYQWSWIETILEVTDSGISNDFYKSDNDFEIAIHSWGLHFHFQRWNRSQVKEKMVSEITVEFYLFVLPILEQ